MSEPQTQFRQDYLPAATILSVAEQEKLTVRIAPRPRVRISEPRTLLRRMVGQGLQMTLPELEATLAIHLTADDEGAAWSAALSLSGPDGAIDIADGARLMRVLTGIDLELPGEDNRNAEWLQSAVLGRLAGTPFSCCDRIAGETPSLSSETEVLRLALHSANHRVTTYLRADAGTFVSLLTSGQWSRMRQPLAAYRSLVMDVPVQVCSHTISAACLRSLSAGDVILPETTAFNVAGEGRLALGKMQFHVQYSAPGTLTVIDVFRTVKGTSEIDHDAHDANPRHTRANMMKGREMEKHHDQNEEHLEEDYLDEDYPDEDHADEDHADDQYKSDEAPRVTTQDTGVGEDAMGDFGELDDVSVTMHFVLGKARLTLGDIRALAAGSIVLFAGGSPESVSIMASDRTLGRGEIVEVDGHLGIRVTQWGNEGE